jgi:hypothetical protein
LRRWSQFYETVSAEIYEQNLIWSVLHRFVIMPLYGYLKIQDFYP